MHMDERLTLAAGLYTAGEWGADIGSDHGYLPCAVLEQGICDRMIVSDISAQALSHARAALTQRGLSDRAVLTVADGLDALDRPVSTVSVTGMGGKLIASILMKDRERLGSASLVLSAHTDQELVREAVCRLGWHLTAEKLCMAANRFYLIWKAEPGVQTLTDEELQLGTPMLGEENPELRKRYFLWRQKVEVRKLEGLRSASEPDPGLLLQQEARLEAIRRRIG